MRIIFLFSLLILIECPYPPNYDGLAHEERFQRRKKLQKEVIDCVLNKEISNELKIKLKENKDEDLRQMVHIFMNKISEKDKEVFRTCRREIFTKFRTIIKDKRYNKLMNRTIFRNHSFNERFIRERNKE